jgi:hypothetical protein
LASIIVRSSKSPTIRLISLKVLIKFSPLLMASVESANSTLLPLVNSENFPSSVLYLSNYLDKDSPTPLVRSTLVVPSRKP